MTRPPRCLPLALLALATFALTECGGGGRDDHRLGRGETLLTVVGSGHADAAPDEAAFVIGVTAIGANAAEASRLDNEKMQKVMASLRGLGVAQDKIQTRTLTLERIDYGADRGKFRANNSVSATMKASGKVGEVVVAATQAGANLLSGPNLTVSDPARAGAASTAAAYKAARARADAYAAAAGLRVERVLAIRDGGQQSIIDVAETRMSVQAAPVSAPAPPPPFSPGMNRSDASVTVDYALAR